MSQAPVAGPVIGLGELLWDCFGPRRHPGGAPANVAYHARQLGLDGVVCSRVGADELGRELLRYLADRGLDIRYIQQDRRHPTGTVTVDTTLPDSPRYTIHQNVAWDHLEFDSAWRELFARAAAVCFGTLAQRSASNRRVLARAWRAARRAWLVYDVNLRPPFYKRQWVHASLGQAHVVKLNCTEVALLAGLLDLPGGAAADFARLLLERYPLRTVCITRGARGCLLVSRQDQADAPGRKVAVADAVGAGDAFTAALTCGLLRGWPLASTAAFANELGALVAARPGAMPRLDDELAELRWRYAGRRP